MRSQSSTNHGFSSSGILTLISTLFKNSSSLKVNKRQISLIISNYDNGESDSNKLYERRIYINGNSVLIHYYSQFPRQDQHQSVFFF